MIAGSRRIIFDTETTGSTAEDRIIEIGLIEVIGHEPTGRRLSHRINPQGQPIHWGAARIHGIRARHLAGKPQFRHLVGEILEFIGDARLFAHNASFDARMLNSELKRLGRPPIEAQRFVCTVRIAKLAWPGESCGIDALMRKLMPGQVRSLHSALEDAEILARLMPHFVPEDDAGLDAMVRKPRPRKTVAPVAPAPAPALGEQVRDELAAEIARVSTAEQAAGLRTGGRDAWSRIGRVQLLEALAVRHDPEALLAEIACLDEKRGDYALRWACRGLPIGLAVARERLMEGETAELQSPGP